MNNCKFYDNGICSLSRHGHKCFKRDNSLFDDAERLEKTDIDNVCRKESPWGNYYFVITDEDIESLKNGKILFYEDEYGTFIAYRGGDMKTNDVK